MVAVQEHRVPTPRPGKTAIALGPPFIPNIPFQKQRSCSLGSPCVRVQASGLLFLLQARGSPALWRPLRGGIDSGHIYWIHHSTRGYKRQTKKIRNRPLGISMACHSYLHRHVIPLQNSVRREFYFAPRAQAGSNVITTTIMGSLEPQMEDRLFTVHPDESTAQTKAVGRIIAEIADYSMAYQIVQDAFRAQGKPPWSRPSGLPPLARGYALRHGRTPGLRPPPPPKESTPALGSPSPSFFSHLSRP